MYTKDFDFLPNPIRLTEQDWPERTTQYVSISCITYNHEHYIRDAIESFLMQKTTFPVKIVVFEDCSTDSTKTILQEYEKQYPHLFAMYYQPVNTYKKPIRIKAKEIKNIERDKAKYTALCEGDDYWTDPLKLQKQFDFMEANPDCSMCYHDVRKVFMTNNKKEKVAGPKINKNLKFTSEEFIKGGYARLVSRFIKTSAIQNKPDWLYKSPIGDYPLQMICALRGNIGYIGGNPMAVYRVGVEGSTNHGRFGTKKERRKWMKRRLANHKKSRDLFNQNSDYKYDKYIQAEKQRFSFKMLYQGIDLFSRKEIFKLYKKYIPYPFKINKATLSFWSRVLLGTKNYKFIKNK